MITKFILQSFIVNYNKNNDMNYSRIKKYMLFKRKIHVCKLRLTSVFSFANLNNYKIIFILF